MAKDGKNLEYQKAARDHFTKRLQICVDRVGSAAALARASGISPATIGDYLSGKSDPTREKLIEIAKAAAVPMAWLAIGEGAPPPSKKVNAPNTVTADLNQVALNDSLFRVPLMNIVASAGDGAAALKEEVQEYMGLSSALVQALRLNAAETFIIFARGESMEPLIRGGEPLLCSRAERHLKANDGVYVIRLEGDILVKHVQRLPGNKVRVFSENPSYTAFEVELNDGTDFAILAKVLHGVRQIGS